MAVVFHVLEEFGIFNDDSFRVISDVSYHSRKCTNRLHHLCDVEPAYRVRKSSGRWIDMVRGC
jgi:hypothetical protein